MRRILTMSLMAIGLTGGLAAADGYRDRDRDHDRDRASVNVNIRAGGPHRGEVVHYRDYNRRPELRVERHEYRRNMIWVGGDWQWRHGEWMWVPGHYVRR
jgi:hypothetical protein